MGVSLRKGQRLDLTKGNPNLKNIVVGLGWDVKRHDSEKDYDLDATAFLLDRNNKVNSSADMIFYNQLSNQNRSVVLSGDNRTGVGEGDDEKITIRLDKVPQNVQKIPFVVTIHEALQKGQNFGQIANAYVRVYDLDAKRELCRYDLGEDFSTETALLTGELYRHKGEWKFQAVGSGYNKGLGEFCREYGVDVDEPAHSPEPEYNIPRNTRPSAPYTPSNPAPYNPYYNNGARYKKKKVSLIKVGKKPRLSKLRRNKLTKNILNRKNERKAPAIGLR